MNLDTSTIRMTRAASIPLLFVCSLGCVAAVSESDSDKALSPESFEAQYDNGASAELIAFDEGQSFGWSFGELSVRVELGDSPFFELSRQGEVVHQSSIRLGRADELNRFAELNEAADFSLDPEAQTFITDSPVPSELAAELMPFAQALASADLSLDAGIETASLDVRDLSCVEIASSAVVVLLGLAVVAWFVAPLGLAFVHSLSGAAIFSGVAVVCTAYEGIVSRPH